MNTNTPVVPKPFSTPAMMNDVKIAEKRLHEYTKPAARARMLVGTTHKHLPARRRFSQSKSPFTGAVHDAAEPPARGARLRPFPVQSAPNWAQILLLRECPCHVAKQM
jgi:hypothetical protein